MQRNNLIEIFKEKSHLTGKGITFITGSQEATFVSYHQLYKLSLKRLHLLQRGGLKHKDELVFQLDDNRTFVVTFWACILGGIVPVPLSTAQNDDSRQKLLNVWPVLNNPYLIATQDILSKLVVYGSAQHCEDSVAEISGKAIVDTGDVPVSGDGVLFPATESDIAFIQFSSGSTGFPKGITLTHKNLITNLNAISIASEYTPDDSMLSWMPLTHDMGLIGFHLNPLFTGMNHFLMPPHLFVKRPSLWMEKASEHRVSVLCSPNFGYWYLLKYGEMPEVNSWDLSSVRLLYNGAEPISWSLCRQFSESLAKFNLRPTAMRPVYGLAEATLAVTISSLNDAVIALHLKRNKLNPGDRVQEAAGPDDREALTFINVGTPVPDCQVRITNAKNQPLDVGLVGCIQIKGNNVTAGYYNNLAATRESVNADGWLNTGDLGFIYDGCLYVTGRAKDIIFVNGENYYPHDFERIAQELDGIELNKVAFTGFFNPENHRDEIICFLAYKGDSHGFKTLAATLKTHVNSRMGVSPDRVIAVKSIPKTTSGKIQRFKLLEKFKRGDFNTPENCAPQLSTGQYTSQAATILPPGDIEEKILRIWRTTLGSEEVNANDKFLEVGGNSLKAAAVAMRVWQEFEVDLPLEMVLGGTAKHLVEKIGSERKRDYFPIPAAPQAKVHPAATAQRRLFYAWSSNPSSVAYNNPVAFRLRGEPDVDKLKQCFGKLIERHDSLRTSFVLNAEPAFMVHDSVDVDLKVIYHERDHLKSLLRINVQAFNLLTPPLFKCLLFVSDTKEFVLFMDFHHIIADGISIVNLINDLLDLYDGKPLQALPVQFKDFAYWEKMDLLSEKNLYQQEYWTRKIETAGRKPGFFLDFIRPPVLDTKGEKFEFPLCDETIVLLKAIASTHATTLHSVLFAFYSILLSKYTAQNSVVIGIPVSGRRHPELQKLAGMFVNNLAIHCEINNEHSFVSCLLNIKNELAQSLKHRDYPFDLLVNRIAEKRDASHNPFFDTMFVYHNMERAEFMGDNLSLTPYFFDAGFAKFDVSMEVFEYGNTVKCFIEYATALFKRETMMGLARHFKNLILSVKDNHHVKISDMLLADQREVDAYIIAFNNTRKQYPQDQQIQHLFERQVIASPDKIAIEFEGNRYSYRQLNDKADDLADALRENGVQPGSVVGIILPRSPEFIIAILAVLKASGCFVPIDVNLPGQRIDRILQVSACQLVIADEQLYEPTCVAHTVRIYDICLFKLVTQPPGLNGNQHRKQADLYNVAYIIFTSGTTGEPKGVMITHRSLVNYAWWAKDVYLHGEDSVFSLFTSVSFDLTLTSIFVPLITGNRILIYGENEGEPVIDRLVKDNKANVVKLTPSHLKLLKNSIQASNPLSNSIRTFIVGGEEFESVLAADVHELFNGEIEIFNEYGPTEATIGCMIYKFDPTCVLKTVPIGLPVYNTQVYLFDRFLKPVPQGIHGEIYVSGDGIFKGYLFNDELTRDKCIPNPYIAGERLYRTGDIGKRLLDGNIIYLGRADNQVKMHGYRIELSEIESHLLSFEAIDEVHVVKRKNENDIVCLYAYYRGRGHSAESDLRNYLAASMPYYMIPQRFIKVESFPLTISGKIDFDRLPLPAVLEGEPRLPKTEVEKQMLVVWREMFDSATLSVASNFYELGGDSIKATQIASKLNTMGINVRVRDILTYHTIEQICQHAEMKRDVNIYDQGSLSGAIPLTPIARWFFSQKFDNPNYYNQSLKLRFNKSVDVRILEHAFRKIIMQHDGLRLNHDPDKNVLFFNETHLDRKFTISEYWLAGNSGAGVDYREAMRSVQSTFDITKDLLIRAAFFHGAGEFGVLFISVHHLVIDGVSWRILLSDLYDVYDALETAGNFNFPGKTASLAQWHRRLAAYAGSELIEAEAGYWSEIENTGFELPVDFETRDWKYRNISRVSGALDERQTTFLLSGAHSAYGTDVPTLLTTALIRALREWTGKDVFIIEMENHGRHIPDIDVSRTIGWFTAMFPLKFELNDDAPGNQVKQVKEQIKNSPRHGLGFGIRKYWNKPADGGNLWPEVRFNYLGQFGKELNNSLFSLEGDPSGCNTDPENNITAKMEINAMVLAGQLIVEIDYNAKAYKHSTIERLHEGLLTQLRMLLEHIANERNVFFTPSDFDAVRLTERELDALFE